MSNRALGFAGAQTGLGCARTVRAMKPEHAVASLDGPTQGDAVGNMTTLSLEQVAQLSGVGTADLKVLVDYGVLTPVRPVGAPWAFPLDCVMTLQRADLMRHDLALDDHGFALSMMLLGQITGLESKLRTTRSKLHKLGTRASP